MTYYMNIEISINVLKMIKYTSQRWQSQLGDFLKPATVLNLLIISLFFNDEVTLQLYVVL